MSKFIGQFIPAHLLVKYDMSQAQSMFCLKLLKSKHFSSVISLIQTNILPNILSELDFNEVKYIQYRKFPQKGFLRLLNNILENISIVLYCRYEKNIWFNNLNAQTLLSCIILKFILRKKVYAILTDHTDSNNCLTVNYWIKRVLEKLNGLVSLSSRTDIKNTNMFFLPGIVLSNSITNSSQTFNHTSFLFSGSLSKVTGIDLALKVFAKLPKFVLHISGKGELVDMVKQYSEKYSNIIYHGFMDVDSYKKMSKQIDFCLSLRNPSLPENRNNFPSKSLEYLSDAKILISTILYPELNGVKYVYSDYSEEALANVVVKLSQMDEDELKQYANNKDVLLEKFSEQAWKHAFESLELNDVKNKRHD